MSFLYHSWYPMVNSWTASAHTMLNIVDTCPGHPMTMRTVFGMDSDPGLFYARSSPLRSYFRVTLFQVHPLSHIPSILHTSFGLT